MRYTEWPEESEELPVIGGVHRIFSRLRISETDRNACPCVLSANVREKRYKSESNQARCEDHAIPRIRHEADGLCRKVEEVRIRLANR